MLRDLRPTLGRVRTLQFLDAQDLSIDRALCAGDIGELACPSKVNNKRAWGASQIKILRKHRYVEAVGRTPRGLDTWAITTLGENYLFEIADIIAVNHWETPWKRKSSNILQKLVSNG